jgi:hypothetical protein
MTTYHESGLVITLPDSEHFRFQDCQAYKPLSGQFLKEMDFGCWQADKNTLWLIEIKEYASLMPEEQLPDHLLDNFVNKATDSLLILAALWAKTNQGLEFASCLPPQIHQFPKRLKFFFILKIDEVLFKSKIGPLKDELKNRLRGRLALFDVRHVTLVDHLTAIKCHLPFRIATI